MSHRTSVLVGAALVAAFLTFPAHAATPRVDTQVYLAAGGANAGPVTAYSSRSEGPGGNLGQVRSTSRVGEKGVRISVTDGSGAPVAARIEVLHKRGMLVIVTCDATKQVLRLRGASEVRVTPLAGVCTPASGSPVPSAPTTGEVVFAYRS